jgi:cytidyltransferase-like protein
MKRILVDMSLTILHHGHIRLLRNAHQFGRVIVALTTDDEVESNKGYVPELDFDSRKEILESIRYVSEVIPSPWLITEDFLDQHSIDFLVHGDDNRNPISPDRLIIFPKVPNISSSIIRCRANENLTHQTAT